jgi:brefeldin A-resistance guanine nucleotide exchange factor 1
MNSSSLLVPPRQGGEDVRTQRQRDLWDASAGRIERVLPGFLGEVVVPERMEEKVEVKEEVAV